MEDISNMKKVLKKPEWLKIRLPDAYEYAEIKKQLNNNKLHTICESGQCPNIGECWKQGTATFMILGNICTRSCHFCNVTSGIPKPADVNEPERIANAVKEMRLKHCVITSVTRDDLQDGGANIWAQTIKNIKKTNNKTTIECLIPDFKGNLISLNLIIKENPNIISHNLETVSRLTKKIRGFAKYELSLQVIKHISETGITSKSGIMVGLGETEDEIFKTMDDLIEAGCKIFTIGQYLRPTKENHAVLRYVHPDEFKMYKEVGLKKGFLIVESGPLVRSSYHAEKHI